MQDNHAHSRGERIVMDVRLCPYALGREWGPPPVLLNWM